MKITNKVRLLKLGFDGLFSQPNEVRQGFTELLYEFEDEIEAYFEAHLPSQNKVYGISAIRELEHITDNIFKDPESPDRNTLSECLRRLSLAASFIPDEQQDI